MTITGNNYNTLESTINWNKIPKVISNMKTDIDDIFEFYNDDNDIKETIDLWLKKLNKALPKDSKKATIKNVAKTKHKQNTKKTQVRKKSKQVQKTIDHYANEFMLIRRFFNIIRLKKKVSFRKTQLLYMAFEKAVVERKVRKTSSKADLFNKVNSKVVKLFTGVSPTKAAAIITLSDKKFYNELENYVKSQKINYAIALLKRFISVQGTKPDVLKVKRLIKAIETAFNNGKVAENNRLYSDVLKAKMELQGYVSNNKTKIKPTKQGLTGVSKKHKKHYETKYKKEVLFSNYIDKRERPKFNKWLEIQLKNELKNIGKQSKKGLKKSFLQPIIKTQKPSLPLHSVSLKNKKPVKLFNFSGAIRELLGNVEIKDKQSVAITVDAPQGQGKTTFAFQLANNGATAGHSVLFVSLEEHNQSELFNRKYNTILSDNAKTRFYSISDLEKNYETLSKLIPQFDIIILDSWNKVLKMNKNLDFDYDLRKKFDGKCFLAVFQRTQDEKMRGGSNAQFDGDIILKGIKEEKFADNYIIADKNRYQDKDISEIKYNIFSKKLMKVE